MKGAQGFKERIDILGRGGRENVAPRGEIYEERLKGGGFLGKEPSG